MRLTDADALFQGVDGLVIADMEVFRAEVLSMILSAPTIDAVPVVRCRECVHAKPIPDAKANYFADGVKCCALWRGNETNGVSVVWDEGYCDDGQRKEEPT